MSNTKYLNIVISELETVIDEVKLLQNNMSNELNIIDSFQICDYILKNFFENNELHSSEALETKFDTVVREKLYYEMSMCEDRYE